MSKIVLFTAANPVAAANLLHSVVQGVDLDVVGDSRMYDVLEERASEGKVRLWGSTSGATGRKAASWRRLAPPAVAFFYSAGRFTQVADIWAKEPASNDGEGNPDLAQAVWADSSFEHIVYLENVEDIDVPPEYLKAALGYEAGYPLGRESIVPSDETQNAVMSAFGSPEAFRNAVVSYTGTPPLDALPVGGLPPSLGVAYRTADEGAKAERNDSFKVDPDVIDRGTQAHAATQNALAEHLRARDFIPKSPSIAEPPYDLAWEGDGTIYVAELKSLTDRNEERQLRLALGQILRYAHQLAYKNKPIKKVIAVEREPQDATWSDLCSSFDVALVWPDTFSEL